MLGSSRGSNNNKYVISSIDNDSGKVVAVATVEV
jgi:hypothetical protein